MADEWFRSPEWNDEARADFEARLARARTYNRPQYLRIKGLALRDAGQIGAARELWLRVLECDAQHVWVQHNASLEQLADSYASENLDLAENYYRRLMRQPRLPSGTTGSYQVSLAELLIRRGTSADLEEAGSLLSDWKANAVMPFWSVHFRWELALIELAEATGEREVARDAARRALDLASRGPVFPRHKTLGLVEAGKKTLERLERLAR